VNEAGIYTVTKVEDGCESSATITISKSTAVNIDDIEGCEADAPITVDATIPDGFSYAWSGGSSINTATNDFTADGIYVVTATDNFACVSSDSFSLVLLGEPAPVISYVGTGGTAVIFSSANSTEVGANSDYLWTFNGIDTSTALNPTYIFPWSAVPATYPVTLEIDNGCGVKLVSKNITLDPLGITPVENGVGFSVYPNPAKDNANIVFEQVVNEGTITLLDLSGRAVYTTSFAGGATNLTLNLVDLAAGTYIVKLDANDISNFSQIIIE
jgi:hypothetical protein